MHQTHLSGGLLAITQFCCQSATRTLTGDHLDGVVAGSGLSTLRLYDLPTAQCPTSQSGGPLQCPTSQSGGPLHCPTSHSGGPLQCSVLHPILKVIYSVLHPSLKVLYSILHPSVKV